MPDKSWKAYERRLAAEFHGKRTPLSGISSGHTHADVIHPTLFVDLKLRREFRTCWRYFKVIAPLAKKEGKIPVIVAKVPGGLDQESLVVCRLKDVKQIAQELG